MSLVSLRAVPCSIVCFLTFSPQPHCQPGGTRPRMPAWRIRKETPAVNDWRFSMTQSSFAFQKFVWPVVRHWCRPGRLELVESAEADGLLRDFDTLAGIDAWHVVEDEGIVRGIASRVQAGDIDWRSFTVRCRRLNGEKTEFEKRMKAIKEWRQGVIFPALTVHAYVQDYRNGPLLSVAMVYTVDLYEYLEKQIEAGLAKTRKADNAEFYWLPWHQVKSNVRLRQWPPIGTESIIA